MRNRINSPNIVTLSLVRRSLCGGGLPKGLLLVGLLVAFSTAVHAQEFANVEYLCADWGPAMTWSGKTNEPPRFSDTEEEVYFLKQVGRFTRKKRLVPDLLSGSKTEEIGHGISIYLCKMKPDGSGKIEIKELWKNPRYPIDTQAQTTWMDVNEKTKKIVFSIVIGGEDITGIWTVNLDGSDLKRILTPGMEEGGRATYGNPSWTPDGQWIVFGKGVRSPKGISGGIAKCDSSGSNIVYLTRNINQETPRVSPDGTTIIYGQIGDAKTGGLYLMDIDGGNPHQLPNPDDKRKGHHSGIYPAWSPDGKRIFAIGYASFIVDAATGKLFVEQSPQLEGKRGVCGWPHWGTLGFVGFNVGGILFTDSELKEAKWLASSGLANCSGKKMDDCKW